MKKLNSLMVLAAAALGLGTLVACGPTASSENPAPSDSATSEVTSSEDKPSEDLPPEESSEDQSSEEEPEEELIEMPELKPGVSMTGTFEGFGGGVIDLILKEGNKVLFDATCNQAIPGMDQEATNKMFDMEGTYEVANNEYTFTVNWPKRGQDGKPTGEVEPKVYFSVYNTRSDVHVVDYVMKGQRDIPARLVGRLPSVDNLDVVAATGTFEGFGGGKIDLIMKADHKVFFDATCNQAIPGMDQEATNKMFDMEGTYEVHGNEYTFTVNWPKRGQDGKPTGETEAKVYISVWDEETQTHTVDYVMKGQRDIPARLVGKLCK